MQASDFDELAFFRAIQVSGAVTTVDGVVVAFDEVWARRQSVALGSDVHVQIPADPTSSSPSGS